MSKLFSARFRRLLRKRLSRGESLPFAGAFGGTAFRLSPLAKLRFALKWR